MYLSLALGEDNRPSKSGGRTAAGLARPCSCRRLDANLPKLRWGYQPEMATVHEPKEEMVPIMESMSDCIPQRIVAGDVGQLEALGAQAERQVPST